MRRAYCGACARVDVTMNREHGMRGRRNEYLLVSGLAAALVWRFLPAHADDSAAQ